MGVAGAASNVVSNAAGKSAKAVSDEAANIAKHGGGISKEKFIANWKNDMVSKMTSTSKMKENVKKLKGE